VSWVGVDELGVDWTEVEWTSRSDGRRETRSRRKRAWRAVVKTVAVGRGALSLPTGRAVSETASQPTSTRSGGSHCRQSRRPGYPSCQVYGGVISIT